MKNKTVSLITSIFLILVLVAMITTITIIIDQMFFNSIHLNHLIYRDECDYQVPENWEIVQNDVDLYAVHKKDNDGIYLYEGRYRTTEMYITIAEPSLFFTECKAKAYLKEYLNSKKPKMIFHK